MKIKSARVNALFRAEALAFPRYSLNEASSGIRLHQNETLGLSALEREEFANILAASAQEPESINTYPSLEPSRLLKSYSAALNIPVENIEVTSGSSQALTLLAEALFCQGRTVAVTSPSFSLYANLVRLYGAEVVEISLNENFNFSSETLFSENVLNSDVAIVCSPNNPTGTVCDQELLVKFADNFRGVLVVDEAYVEFARDPLRQSFLAEAIKRENVIVLRTLSKAWGAAGLRVGAIVANEEIVSLFRALKPPYSIAWPSEILASYVLECKSGIIKNRIKNVVMQKNELLQILRECAQVTVVTNSEANFVFFITSRADILERALFDAGFLVRRYSSGRLRNAIRISMPPQSEFERLKNILIEVLK